VLAIAAGDRAAADSHLAHARRDVAAHGWRGLPPRVTAALSEHDSAQRTTVG